MVYSSDGDTHDVVRIERRRLGRGERQVGLGGGGSRGVQRRTVQCRLDRARQTGRRRTAARRRPAGPRCPDGRRYGDRSARVPGRQEAAAEPARSGRGRAVHRYDFGRLGGHPDGPR